MERSRRDEWSRNLVLCCLTLAFGVLLLVATLAGWRAWWLWSLCLPCMFLPAIWLAPQTWRGRLPWSVGMAGMVVSIVGWTLAPVPVVGAGLVSSLASVAGVVARGPAEHA